VRNKRQGLILCLIFILFTFGCSSPSAISPSITTYWFQTGETVQTNDLKKLSELVPFKIILPAYIPQDLISELPRLSKNNTGWSNESIRIKIAYDNKLNDEPKFIHIFQDNSSQTWEPNQIMKPITYLEGEINITQQTGKVEIMSKSGRIFKDKYNFFWKNNGINFDVDICGYDLVTSKQVIKSMLQ
jgi:hypothetical protein